MILMYHKVHPDSPTMWWVTVDQFYRQLCELQSKKVVYLDEYDPADPDQVVITFDGVYQNVLTYAAPLLKKFKYPFELFVTGKYIGKNNEFDSVEPLAPFANKKELAQLVKLGGRLQWHTHSHPKLNEVLDPSELKTELTVPAALQKLDPKGYTWIAYPHSLFDERTIAAAKKLFKGGLSVIHGNDTDVFELNRQTVVNDTKLSAAKISVIIPSYNYGSFLIEAIESVLKQTRPVDEILIVDDASSDNTAEIGKSYAEKHPTIIRFHQNSKNLGIIPTFNNSVDLVTGDYICFLGADNRFRSDYIEKTAALLDADPERAVAYTDFVLFGPRASIMYDMMPPDRRGEIIEQEFYIVQFPDFTADAIEKLDEINFMHGSSLYRRSAFYAVGGYQKAKKKAEDHNLFQRMIEAGWKAARVPEPVLEYRQHSKEQVNTRLNSFAELQFYKQRLAEHQTELAAIKSSKFWKLLYLYKQPKQAGKQYAKKLLSKVFEKVLSKLN